jgi:hypothetical protein
MIAQNKTKKKEAVYTMIKHLAIRHQLMRSELIPLQQMNDCLQ